MTDGSAHARAPGAYLFDLDGTLIDSEIIWVEAVRRYLAEHIGAYEPADAEALVYGRSWHDIHIDICRDYPPLAMPIADMEARIAPYYHEVAAGRDIRIQGSIDLLRRLARERPVCIVSGSSTKTVAAAVDHLGIADALQFFLGADDYAPGKPDPAGYLLAAKRLRVPAADCLVFEDSEAGLRAAKAAGMRCVVLLRDARASQDFSTADLLLADLADFDPAALRMCDAG